MCLRERSLLPLLERSHGLRDQQNFIISYNQNLFKGYLHKVEQLIELFPLHHVNFIM